MKFVKETASRFYTRFESLDEMLEYVHDASVGGPLKNEDGSYKFDEHYKYIWPEGDFDRGTCQLEWTARASQNYMAGDVATWQDAVSLAENGWSEKRKDVDSMTDMVFGQVQEMVDLEFQSRFDVTGSAIDMGRFLDGEPECMIEFHEEHAATQGNMVTVLVNASYAGMVSSRKIAEQGAAICALVEALGKLNRSVEIWMEDLTVVGRNMHSTLVKVKDATDYMDSDQLMFCMGHAAFLRRLCFAVMEMMDVQYHDRFNTGNGYGAAAPPVCKKIVGADIVLGDSNINGMVFDGEWVVGKMKELGIEFVM